MSDQPGSSVMMTQVPNNAWGRCNLLSLDGGGIRGYWTLLALKQLMEYVANEELELDENQEVHHSFYPQHWPENVSQMPWSKEEVDRGIADATTVEQRCLKMDGARRFLPCHYFDHICGSSTGALIAILLGRFRMTVQDCIEEYKTLGEEVFGKPRFFCTLHFGLGDTAKYSASKLRRVFEDVSARRSERFSPPDRNTFPSGPGLCKTFVTTLRTGLDDRSGTLYLIRSYDHVKRNSPANSRVATRANTIGTNRSNTGRTNTELARTQNRQNGDQNTQNRVNYGKAQNFEIWEVARAATAAKWFFKPLQIERPGTEKHVVFKDGGFGTANNPTQEASSELGDLRGANSIGIAVSVGTARKEEDLKRTFFNPLIAFVKENVATATDPEAVHRHMLSEFQKEGVEYFRINDPGKLAIRMDEWKPRKPGRSSISGAKTLTTIENAFNAWILKTDNQNSLRTCATRLVESRQARMGTPRWERFATAAWFDCQARRCESPEFTDRQSFAYHLKNEHPDRLNTNHEEENACIKHWKYRAASKV